MLVWEPQSRRWFRMEAWDGEAEGGKVGLLSSLPSPQLTVRRLEGLVVRALMQTTQRENWL